MRTKNLEKILKALANRRRLAMLAHLKSVKESSVGSIASELHLAFKTVSRNLVMLERAGILEKRIENNYAIYRLSHTFPLFIKNILSEL